MKASAVERLVLKELSNPPATNNVPPTAAAAATKRGVGSAAAADQLSVIGSYTTTGLFVLPYPPAYPPVMYNLALITPPAGPHRGEGKGAPEVQVLVVGS